MKRLALILLGSNQLSGKRFPRQMLRRDYRVPSATTERASTRVVSRAFQALLSRVRFPLSAPLLLLATPALATPTFTVSAPQCTLGYHCAIKITKSGYASSYSDIAVRTSGMVAQPVTPTVRFQRGDTVKTVYAQSLKAGSFTATITRIRYAIIEHGTAMAMVVSPPAQTPPPAPMPTPPPAPAPMPMPMPMPAPVPSGYVPSPALDGTTPISDGTDGSQALQPSWGSGALPASGAPDVVGAFRFICTAGQVLADDPIIYPGQPGLSHLHQFYGNEAANASSTYASLRTSGTSTCNRGVAVPGNRSAYWMPAMLDANGQVVKPAFVSIYYKRRPASDQKCSLALDMKAEGNCVGIPTGLRFIFGYDMLTGKSPTGEAYFNCQGPGAVPGAYPDIPTALANCPAGAQLGAVIKAPGCWDGKNLDTPNHRDHVAYPGYGDWGYLRCPSTHPYRIPDFTLGAWYPVVPGMHLASDMMVPGVTAGKTFHADYWEAWNLVVKLMWTANCIDKMLNCSGGDTGNGLQLKGAQ